ncbi:hypothetical protein ACLI09_17000 [Flavobacterium sp. RHBU_24]|uniref:hypothetical protein n=1 Tax=Flavobacterium sp. RHBU_24 TaxID=3391185 RepID=UPI003984CD42
MRTINNFFVLILLFSMVSCEDLLEEDITNDMVTTSSPVEGEEVHSNVVTFKWNDLKGADDYRLQVYTSGTIVLDSLISTNNFTYSLNPGTYQWRVRGENFAYQTGYTFPVNFTLIESDDLDNQQVPLVSPLSGIYSNNGAMTFSWTGLTAATTYEFQLLNVTAGSTIVLQQSDIEETFFTLTSGTITDDAQYMWKVRAYNADNNSQTQFASRSFYIDTTAPLQPQNSLPENNDSLSLSSDVNFEWNIGSDPGTIVSPVTYSLQIATDTGFNNIIETANVSTTSYNYTFSNTGTYYWRVRANDQAGNQGAYGSYYKLILQ